MNRILHLARKDLSYLYPGLAGCYVLIIVPCILFTLAASGVAPSQLDPLGVQSYSLVCAWLYLILSSFVLVRLIQSDSLVGTTAFWLTRPVSRHTLLAAKVFFVGLLLVLVPLTIESGALLANGLSLQDLKQHLPDILFRWLLLTLPFITLASLSSDYGRFSILLVATFASWVVTYFFGELYLWEHTHIPYPVLAARRIVWIVLTLSVSTAVLAHQFLTRKLKRSLLLGSTGLIATTICTNFWTKPAKSLQLQSAVGPGFAALKASLLLTPVRDLGFSRSAQQRLVLAVSDPRTGIDITGVPQGYICRPLSIRRPSASFVGVESALEYQRSLGAFVHNRSTQGTSVLEPVLGPTSVLNPPVKDRSPLDARFMMLLSPSTFGISVEEGLAEELGARKEIGNTEVVLLASKLETGVVLPARPGASSRDKELTKVFVQETRYWADGVDVALQQCRLKMSLSSPTWREPTLWVLRNRKTRDAILGQEQRLASLGDYGWAMLSPMAQTLSIQSIVVQFRLSSTALTLDRDWLQEAELVRVRAVPVGYLTKPISIKMGSS